MADQIPSPQPAHQAEPDHDAWKCDRCHGEGWHWVEREGVEWRDKVHSKEHCEQCDGLGFLGPDAAKAAEAELDKVLAEYRDASDHFDAEVLARFIKAYPKHAAALRRYSTVQLTFVQPTREEIEAEEVPAPDPAQLPKGWRLQTVSDGDIRMYSPTGSTWLLRANTNEDFYDFIHGFLSDLMAAIPAPEGAQLPPLPHPLLIAGGGQSWFNAEQMRAYARAALAAPAPQDSLDSAQSSKGVAMQAPQAPAWQPIETAPKERGGLVDIICNERRYTGCHYDRICDEYRHITACGVLIRLKGATHWMPIPAAPQTKEPTNDR